MASKPDCKRAIIPIKRTPAKSVGYSGAPDGQSQVEARKQPSQKKYLRAKMPQAPASIAINTFSATPSTHWPVRCLTGTEMGKSAHGTFAVAVT